MTPTHTLPHTHTHTHAHTHTQVPNYDITENNPICLQLPWDTDPALFSLWKEGRTGYPWIDAAMRQLKKEGWIHYHLRLGVGGWVGG